MNSLPASGNCVHIVDDDPAVRDALSMLLGAEGYRVRTYKSGAALLDGLSGLEQGCVIVDVKLPGGLDGLEIQAEISRRRAGLAVILLSGAGDIPTAVRAIKAGAVDFIEKPCDPDVLLNSVEQALRTNSSLPVADTALRKLASLTSREKQVLQYLIAGDTSKQIARVIGASPRTIEIHRARITEKLGARNAADVVRIALYNGWQRAAAPEQNASFE